ncbi:MAG: hypothetical protein ACLFT5_09200 [Desulfovermiculus sp.]
MHTSPVRSYRPGEYRPFCEQRWIQAGPDHNPAGTTIHPGWQTQKT